MSNIKVDGFIFYSFGILIPPNPNEFALNVFKLFEEHGFKLRFDQSYTPEEITKVSHLKFDGKRPWPDERWGCVMYSDLLDQETILIDLGIELWKKENLMSFRVTEILRKSSCPLNTINPLVDQISDIMPLLHDFTNSQLTIIIPNNFRKIYTPFKISKSDFQKMWQYIYKPELSEKFELDETAKEHTKNGSLVYKTPKTFSDFAIGK